jgi:hypothetical protein
MLELNKQILQWSFLSMGLRGVSVFFPLIVIMLLKGKKVSPLVQKLVTVPLFLYIGYVISIIL